MDSQLLHLHDILIFTLVFSYWSNTRSEAWSPFTFCLSICRLIFFFIFHLHSTYETIHATACAGYQVFSKKNIASVARKVVKSQKILCNYLSIPLSICLSLGNLSKCYLYSFSFLFFLPDFI